MGPQTQWLPGFEKLQIPKWPGGAYVDRGAGLWKILLHTTEGPSIEAAVAAYKTTSAPPHVTVDLDQQRYVQHVPLGRSAYALRNMRGGTQTNRDHVIQVEMVGYARDTRTWPPLKLMRLASVLEQLMDAVPDVDLHFANFDYNDSAEYGLGNPVEMTAGEWDAFSGILGHVHAPENTHWDPGALDTDALLALMTAGEQGNMAHFEKYTDPNTGFECITVEHQGKVHFRQFSQARGEGQVIQGLGYVAPELESLGLIERVR